MTVCQKNCGIYCFAFVSASSAATSAIAAARSSPTSGGEVAITGPIWQICLSATSLASSATSGSAGGASVAAKSSGRPLGVVLSQGRRQGEKVVLLATS